MTILCIAPGCRILGWHKTECVSETCPGCLARSAHDGLNLCYPHTEKVGENATRAADVYEELAEQLAPAGTGGEMVAGTKDRGLKYNPRAGASRSAIRDVLTSWCRLVADVRGFDRPADTVPAMASFLANNKMWLAAYPAADDCAEELRELAYGEPWRVAYPTNARVWPLRTPCPDCAGSLLVIRRSAESLKRSEVACDGDGHRWQPHEWIKLTSHLDANGLVKGDA